nr:unnamed protein product [Digitaria exilis]
MDVEASPTACCRICLASGGARDRQVFIASLTCSFRGEIHTVLLLIDLSSLGFGTGDGLISPCMCKGTQQFVHRACLDRWRAVKTRNEMSLALNYSVYNALQEGTAFSHCTTCKAQFHLRVEFLEDGCFRRMKFQLFVARDVFLVFLAVQAVYIVEDLQGGYATPPKMDPEHEQRLKTLQLM